MPLVVALGVGATTHTLQLALGVATLLAGLGVVCIVMGAAFIWHTRSSGKVSSPDSIPEPPRNDTPAETRRPADGDRSSRSRSISTHPSGRSAGAPAVRSSDGTAPARRAG